MNAFNRQNRKMSKPKKRLSEREMLELLENEVKRLKEIKKEDELKIKRVQRERDAAKLEVKKMKVAKIKNKKKLTEFTTMTVEKAAAKLLWWSRNRRAQYKIACRLYRRWAYNLTEKKRLVLEAPPKSGKRIIFEIIALLFFRDCFHEDCHKKKPYGQKFKPSDWKPPLHITGFNRKSCKQQLQEMRDLGFYSEACSKASMSKDLFDDYRNKYITSPEDWNYVLLGIDEADYASGKKMILDIWINQWPGSNLCITASPGEIIAGWIERGAKGWDSNYKKTRDKNEKNYFLFKPPNTFRGKKWFIDQNLIRTPSQFVDIIRTNRCAIPRYEISNHGKQIIYENNCHLENNKNSNRHTIIVRKVYDKTSSYSDMKHGLKDQLSDKMTKGIYEDEYHDDDGIAKKIKYKIKFVDADEGGSFQFDKRYCWEDLDHTTTLIIFICQKMSRSTELAQPKYDDNGEIIERGAHHYIYAAHDNRLLSLGQSNYNTVEQALGRYNHYHKSGHPILLYCCIIAVKIEAKIKTTTFDYEEWERRLKNMSTRLKRKKKSDTSESSSDDEYLEHSHEPTKNSAYSLTATKNNPARRSIKYNVEFGVRVKKADYPEMTMDAFIDLARGRINNYTGTKAFRKRRKNKRNPSFYNCSHGTRTAEIWTLQQTMNHFKSTKKGKHKVKGTGNIKSRKAELLTFWTYENFADPNSLIILCGLKQTPL